jgi:hypothetical protein
VPRVRIAASGEPRLELQAETDESTDVISQLQRLQRPDLTARLTELRRIRDDEGLGPISASSATSLLAFLEHYTEWPTPSLSVSPSGDLQAIWRTRVGGKLIAQFCDESVLVAIVTPRRITSTRQTLGSFLQRAQQYRAQLVA